MNRSPDGPAIGVEVIENSHRIVIEVRQDLLTALLGFKGYTITSIGESPGGVTVYMERPIVEVK